MLVKYVGGLAKAAPPWGGYPPVAPGGDLEVLEEHAALLVDTGEWVPVDPAKPPKKKAATPVAPQIGD